MSHASLMLVLALAAAPPALGAAATHAVDIERQRAERIVRLTAPEGWLSLVGLHWFEPGAHRVGSGADNDIVIASGPARLGMLELKDAGLTLTLADGVAARADGKDVSGSIALQPDSAPTPTRLYLDDGLVSLQVVERGGRFGLRMRDARAATRTRFAGLTYFPIDSTWRIEARFQPHPAGQTIEIANVLGQLEPMPNPGRVHFARDGREYALEAVDEGDGRLFLIFADRTTGRSTYGAGRFLYADAPVDGRAVLDFNLAYNPPCAFTEYSTCPLPPPGNRLDLEVTAGERRYEAPAP